MGVGARICYQLIVHGVLAKKCINIYDGCDSVSGLPSRRSEDVKCKERFPRTCLRVLSVRRRDLALGSVPGGWTDGRFPLQPDSLEKHQVQQVSMKVKQLYGSITLPHWVFLVCMVLV